MPDDNRVNPDQRVERVWLYRYLAGPRRWTVWPATAGNPAAAPQRADTEWIEVISLSAVSELVEALERSAQRHHDSIAGSRLHDPENIEDFRDCPCLSCKAATETLARFPVPDEKEEADASR